MSQLTNAAALLGRKGGKVRSERKAQSSRENGKKGGRPRLNRCPVCLTPGPGKFGDAFECEKCKAGLQT